MVSQGCALCPHHLAACYTLACSWDRAGALSMAAGEHISHRRLAQI